MNPRPETIQQGTGKKASGAKGEKLVAQVKSGSVTVKIFASQNSVNVLKKPGDGTAADAPPEFELKHYQSFIVPYYEGSIRKTPRRSTLEKAMKLANETAKRLSKDGARAAFMSEKDRRIYFLAKMSAEKMGMDVDELCRKYVELQGRLKTGTLEQAVDFHNDHGQRVKHDVANTSIYEEYQQHLQKRGAGEYHKRDIKRYVGSFITTFPGSISPVETTDVDTYLGKLKGRARSKNNVRDAIIGYFNFAQEKGYLPQGIPHAASLTTEFRDGRQKIETEAQALVLLQPNDIYLPDQMQKLLAAAKNSEPELLPTIELKAFSGVRTEEMVRLWWVMVCEPEELIRIPDAVGKIDARRVPILPNLKLRLAAHAAAIKRDRVSMCVGIGRLESHPKRSR